MRGKCTIISAKPAAIGLATDWLWAKLTTSSPDTALRDISDLVLRGVLKRDQAGGRSTSYSLSKLL